MAQRTRSYAAVLAGMRSRMSATPTEETLVACLRDIQTWDCDKSTKDGAGDELRRCLLHLQSKAHQ